MLKICAFCGKQFDAKTANQKYCDNKCYRQAQKDLEIAREYERRISKRKELVIHIYKAWDPKDRECQEVYFLIKTFKPIDWNEVYATGKKEQVMTHEFIYVSS